MAAEPARQEERPLASSSPEKSSKNTLGTWDAEGLSLAESEARLAEKGREAFGMKKEETDAKVEEAAVAFQQANRSWWQKTKAAFSKAKGWITNEAEIKKLDAHLTQIKAEYQQQAEAATKGRQQPITRTEEANPALQRSEILVQRKAQQGRLKGRPVENLLRDFYAYEDQKGVQDTEYGQVIKDARLDEAKEELRVDYADGSSLRKFPTGVVLRVHPGGRVEEVKQQPATQEQGAAKLGEPAEEKDPVQEAVDAGIEHLEKETAGTQEAIDRGIAQTESEIAEKQEQQKRRERLQEAVKRDILLKPKGGEEPFTSEELAVLQKKGEDLQAVEVTDDQILSSLPDKKLGSGDLSDGVPNAEIHDVIPMKLRPDEPEKTPVKAESAYVEPSSEIIDSGSKRVVFDAAKREALLKKVGEVPETKTLKGVRPSPKNEKPAATAEKKANPWDRMVLTILEQEVEALKARGGGDPAEIALKEESIRRRNEPENLRKEIVAAGELITRAEDNFNALSTTAGIEESFQRFAADEKYVRNTSLAALRKDWEARDPDVTTSFERHLEKEKKDLQKALDGRREQKAALESRLASPPSSEPPKDEKIATLDTPIGNAEKQETPFEKLESGMQKAAAKALESTEATENLKTYTAKINRLSVAKILQLFTRAGVLSSAEAEAVRVKLETDSEGFKKLRKTLAETVKESGSTKS